MLPLTNTLALMSAPLLHHVLLGALTHIVWQLGKKMTLSGEAMDAINDDSEEDVDYGEMRHADQMSLPGARSESLLRRKKLMKAEVNCVSVCPTGRLWAAVSTEGVLVYSEESNIDDGLGEDW